MHRLGRPGQKKHARSPLTPKGLELVEAGLPESLEESRGDKEMRPRRAVTTPYDLVRESNKICDATMPKRRAQKGGRKEAYSWNEDIAEKGGHI